MSFNLTKLYPKTWAELEKLGVKENDIIIRSLSPVNQIRKRLGLKPASVFDSVQRTLDEVEEALNGK